MNILLVSQCEKRALKETRRILDQFAERRGDRTWQTPITQAGLDTLRKLLRRTARKNTAVACHWIRGLDHSELLWIVGDARRFNAEGAVPTNTTVNDILRADDENDWHSLEAIAALAQLAGLLHDLGKASVAFQQRLAGQAKGKNLYRHEWVSLRLFQAFVGGSGGEGNDDASWLRRLAAGDFTEADWTAEGRYFRDGLDKAPPRPFETLPPLARAVGWLILTHHRLPTLPDRENPKRPILYHGMPNKGLGGGDLDRAHLRVDALWNEPHPLSEEGRRMSPEPYWTFEHGLPVSELTWRKRVARHAQQLMAMVSAQPERDWLADPFLIHVARLCLMVADHHYSGLGENDEAARRAFLNKSYPLYANTEKPAKGTVSAERAKLNQTLDEHLLGVTAHAGQVAHALPALTRNLSHLLDHKGLKKRSANPLFRWQDRASDLAASLRDQAAERGAFIINMASTGCGKTLGNARIMNAIADPVRGLRCAFAIGLRTLTLQTGRAFQKRLGLDEEALAILVGGSGSRELFEFYEQQAEARGAESAQDLLEEDSYVLYEGHSAEESRLVPALAGNSNIAKLLTAPLLVCTVDHLTPATESLRGGRQIAPMLRLLSGDLVLDEPDDFGIDDLPALTRLVHWAGLLGSRVLLSSATLPPALIEGLFLAYCEGRKSFQQNRGARPLEPVNVCCLWTDEFAQRHADCAGAESFRAEHGDFVRKRVKTLAEQPVRRIAELLPMNFTTQNKAARRSELARILRDGALRLHAAHHSIDPQRGRRVSFGLIRMANIEPLFDVALELFRVGAPPGTHIHLCAYHSRFPLFLRSRIEQQLDAALDRHDAQAVFSLPEIRQRIDAFPDAADHLFIVLGSPVTEVGRDHDYDWAVVEPSSMRSLIQLLGRILRHRMSGVSQPNVLILESNLRHFEKPAEAAYRRPGFEENSGGFRLRSHNLHDLLSELLDGEGRAVIDARPRILAAEMCELRPSESLVDLEHARLVKQMLPQPSRGSTEPRRLRRSQVASAPELNASSYWQRPYATLTGLLQQRHPFREQGPPEMEVVFLPDDDEEEPRLHYIFKGNRRWENVLVPIDDSKLKRIEDGELSGPNISPWGTVDLFAAMRDQAEAMGIPLPDFARKFAAVKLLKSGNSSQGWRFHPALGFARDPFP